MNWMTSFWPLAVNYTKQVRALVRTRALRNWRNEDEIHTGRFDILFWASALVLVLLDFNNNIIQSTKNNLKTSLSFLFAFYEEKKIFFKKWEILKPHLLVFEWGWSFKGANVLCIIGYCEIVNGKFLKQVTTKGKLNSRNGWFLWIFRWILNSKFSFVFSSMSKWHVH